MIEGGNTVQSTDRTNTAITLKYTLPKITRVCSKSPFFDTPVRAKRPATDRNFEIASAAETASVFAASKDGLIYTPTRHRPLRTHSELSIDYFDFELLIDRDLQTG